MVNGEGSESIAPPEGLRTAVAKHNLAVLLRHMDEAGLGKVVARFDACFGEESVYQVGCLYGPRQAKGVADAPAPATFVDGLVGLDRDASGAWRAVSEPARRFETAVRETVRAALDVAFPEWQYGPGSEGSVTFDGLEADIAFGMRREEVDWGHGWLRPGEMEEMPAVRSDAADDRLAEMRAVANRHNLALVIDAMGDVGVEEVTIRTLPPPTGGKVAKMDWSPGDAVAVCETKAVSGLIGVCTESGAVPRHREVMPGTLDLALQMLAQDLLESADEMWEQGIGKVTIDADGARMEVERVEAVHVVNEATLPPARLAEKALAGPEEGDGPAGL